jgi:DNA ligase-1
MFSRNFEDQANYYPDLRSKLENGIVGNEKNLENFIVDGEICCFSKSLNKYVDFQELRKKINDPDKIYFVVLFDVLFLNLKDLSQEKLEIRKLNLIRFFQKASRLMKIESGTKINFHTNTAVEIISKLFKKARSENCEGLVLKDLGEKSKYEFGKRKWYKVKSIDSKNCETLDLIPIAGFIGTGKNANKLSCFLMASYDSTNNNFIALCKLGIGFTEETLDGITESVSKLVLKGKPSNYIIPNSIKPSIYFKPKFVWEVGFDSFSISQNYSLGAGIIDETKPDCGISMRFPRFYRFRPDKSVENSNSPEEIIGLFSKFRNNDV